MTNAEAAKIIDHLGIKQVYDDTVSATEIGEALTLAISALNNVNNMKNSHLCFTCTENCEGKCETQNLIACSHYKRRDE